VLDMRVRALAILVLLVPAVFPAAAQAHATLLRTDPAAGTEVARAPARIVLHFDQQVADAGTTAVSSTGASVLSGRAHPSPGDSKALIVPLKPRLKDGDYTVRWKVVSADGHIISGVMAIGVGLNRPPPQAASTETSALDWPFLIARFVYYCGLMLLVGGAVFRVWVFRPVMATLAGRPREMAELRERARANSVLLASAALMLAGGWVALTREGAEVAGVSFWQAFNHRGPIGSALQATRFGREFGRGIDLGAAFCVVTAAAFAVSRRSRNAAIVLAVPAALLGVWAVIVPGLSGHAGDPGLGLPAVVVDAVHTAAAAVWIGGLFQLVVVTPHATRGLPDADRSRVRATVAGRFSRIALASIVVLAATGTGRALWAVSSPAELWQTGYGRALLVKTALLACLVALGYRNRRNLTAFGSIRRRGIVEIGLLGALLAVVSLLTDLPPANTPGFAAAAPQPVRAGGPVSLPLGKTGHFTLWPGYAGRNVIDLRLPGHARTASVVTGNGAARTTLRQAPDGSYAGILPALPAGRVAFVIASGNGRFGATATLGAHSGAIPVPAAPAVTGPVAAGEAADLAVGAQRVGTHGVRLTVLSPTGGATADALALVDGHVATPCAGVRGVCYQAHVTARAATVVVSVRRPGRVAATAHLQLPAANAQPATGLVTVVSRNFAALRSLRAINVLKSAPGRSVTTHYITQAPNRLAITVRGGEHARIIGSTRWDLQPDGTWTRSVTFPVQQPDPYWAPTSQAAYVAGRSHGMVQVTLVQPGGPTFFRLWIDRRSHQVVRLKMITNAHFMSERELDLNHAPPVVPPT
jgi:copper transport protein